MRLDYTSASTLTESSILYTHGQTDTWTNKQTNKQAVSSIHPKKFVLQGYDNTKQTNTKNKEKESF